MYLRVTIGGDYLNLNIIYVDIIIYLPGIQELSVSHPAYRILLGQSNMHLV
jgi:hypothetical protein